MREQIHRAGQRPGPQLAERVRRSMAIDGADRQHASNDDVERIDDSVLTNQYVTVVKVHDGHLIDELAPLGLREAFEAVGGLEQPGEIG